MISEALGSGDVAAAQAAPSVAGSRYGQTFFYIIRPVNVATLCGSRSWSIPAAGAVDPLCRFTNRRSAGVLAGESDEPFASDTMGSTWLTFT